MKKILVAVVTATLSTEVSAVDFGVGVSAKSDDSWIYLPIEITQNFRVEPSVRFSQTDSTQESAEERFGGLTTTTVDSEMDQFQVGIGVFGVLPIKESVRVYYGLRAAYIDAETSSTVVSRFETPTFVDENTFKFKNSADGYRLAPTLGFEYFLNESFSIGGEAEWFYEDVEQDNEQQEEQTSLDQTRHGTDTHVVIRYRF